VQVGASASAVATYAFVNPVVAVSLGWLVGGETMNPLSLAATGFILTAVFALHWARRPRTGSTRLRLPAPRFRRKAA